MWINEGCGMRGQLVGAPLASAEKAARVSIPKVAMIGALLIALGDEARSEIEISVYTGVQSADSTNVTGSDPTGAGAFDFGASWDGRSFNPPYYYGFRATWWRTEAWGFHADFTHSKAYASDATLSASGFQTLEFTDGLNNFTLGVTRRWRNQWGRFTPYVGGGVGVVIPHVEVKSSATATGTINYQVAGPNVAWMAGVTYDLTEKWRLFGEYKGSYSWLNADLDGGGDLSTNIWTNALNFGVSFAF